MKQLFYLNPNVSIRKEWFGCLCGNRLTKEFFQFDEDAFEIIKHLDQPRSCNDLVKLLSKNICTISANDLQQFIIDLRQKNLIVSISDVSKFVSGGKIFYKNKKTFRKDCLVAPFSTTLYITEFCPKRCKHCIVSASPNIARNNELNLDQWVKILGKLRDAGVFSIAVTGGEPFTRKDIFDLLKEIDRLGLSISLMTDYDGISQKHIDKLSKLKHLSYVQTSLDGGKAETHDYIRGKGSFEKTIKRMKLFQDNQIPYTLSSVISKKNISEIDDIAEISNRYAASYVYLNPLSPYGRAKKLLQDIILSPKELKELSRKYYQLVSANKIHSGNAFWQNLQEGDITEDFDPFGKAPDSFSLGTYIFSISSEGKCFLDSKMKAENLLCLGNALCDSIEEMWSRPQLNDLRKIHSWGKFNVANHSQIDRLVNSSTS